MKFDINSALYCSATAVIELPIESWEEVKSWYVKWDVLHFTLDGVDWQKVDLNSDTSDGIGWKRPLSVDVMSEDGLTLLAALE